MRVLISFFCVLFLIGVGFAQNDAAAQISIGDSLYNVYDNTGALKAYQAALELDSNNYEAYWKAARAAVDVGETLEDEPREQHYKMGAKYARLATKVNPEGSKGHLYLSIALGRVALDAGAKERIRLSKEIKKEVDLALKYDPNDDIAWHVLGRWHRKLSNLSWIEKGFANMFLGGVPKDASEEKAVNSFKKAIELNPDHINHHLELGITYEMIGNDELAAEEYKKVLEMPKKDSDDDNHKAEAKERLEDL